MNNKLKISLGCLLAVSLIGTIDYLVFYQFVFSIFYLLPILVGSYYINQEFGLLLALISNIIWTLSDTNANFDNKYHILLHGWNFLVRFSVFITLILLLERLKRALKHESYHARIDNLTGVFNRRYFLELLEQEIKRTRRHYLKLSLAYIDLDNFKFVNDNFGHHQGDIVLQNIITIIKQEIREIDILARLGGDEFVLLLPETDAEGGKTLCKRLQNKVLIAMQLQSLPVSLSIGLVTFTQAPESSDLVLQKADQLMYKVKTSGKNNIKYEVF